MSNKTTLGFSLGIPLIQLGLITGILFASFALPSLETKYLESIGELLCILGILLLGGGFVLLMLIEIGLSWSARTRRVIAVQAPRDPASARCQVREKWRFPAEEQQIAQGQALRSRDSVVQLIVPEQMPLSTC